MQEKSSFQSPRPLHPTNSALVGYPPQFRSFVFSLSKRISEEVSFSRETYIDVYVDARADIDGDMDT